MIAHVAHAEENRGRVVVRLGELTPSSKAVIAASVHVARAFQSGIEAVFVEDPALFDASALGFARHVSHSGSTGQTAGSSPLDRQMTHVAAAMHRELAARARDGGVPFEARTVRDSVIGALQAACAERGPWNIIAFAEPVVAGHCEQLAAALATVWGATGCLVAAPATTWRNGPVLVAVEDTDRLTGMIRAAERMAQVQGDPVLIMPVGADEIALDWLEAEIRLMLADAPRLTILPRQAYPGRIDVLRASCARHRPRLIIAKNGGLLMGSRVDQALADLATPVFMVH
jgi:hypothetical protein